jgi:hypothetical protein
MNLVVPLICFMEVEDIDHLLFNCDFSRKGVDVRIYKWMHVDFFFPLMKGVGAIS